MLKSLETVEEKRMRDQWKSRWLAAIIIGAVWPFSVATLLFKLLLQK